MPYVADDLAWPVCVDKMSGVATDEDVERYNAQRLARLQRGEVHVQVIDGSRGASMNAAQRRMLAEFNAEHRETQARLVAGVAFVGGSPLVRTVLRTIYALHPPAYPHSTFDAREPAIEWAVSQLARRRG